MMKFVGFVVSALASVQSITSSANRATYDSHGNKVERRRMRIDVFGANGKWYRGVLDLADDVFDPDAHTLQDVFRKREVAKRAPYPAALCFYNTHESMPPTNRPYGRPHEGYVKLYRAVDEGLFGFTEGQLEIGDGAVSINMKINEFFAYVNENNRYILDDEFGALAIIQQQEYTPQINEIDAENSSSHTKTMRWDEDLLK